MQLENHTSLGLPSSNLILPPVSSSTMSRAIFSSLISHERLLRRVRVLRVDWKKLASVLIATFEEEVKVDSPERLKLLLCL